MVQVCGGVGVGKGVEGAAGKWNSILEGEQGGASRGPEWLTMESRMVPSAGRVTRETLGRNREARAARSDCPASTPCAYCLPSAPHLH